MPLLDDPPKYRAYLLRFWEERGRAEGEGAWRLSLEDPHTGERRGFGDLEALVDWLRAEMMQKAELPQGGMFQ